MAGLFSSDSNDLLTRITQERQQANQALGSPYGKYSGIVSTGAGLADIGADAMASGGAGGAGASDPRMQQMNTVKNIFAQVGMQVGNTSSPEFYKALAQAFTQQGFADQAQKASEKATEVEAYATDLELKKQQLSTAKLSADKEAAMRKDLAALGEKATDDQIRGVVMKYGDASAIIADLSRRDVAKQAAEARRDAAAMAAQARKDALDQRAQDKALNKPKDVAEKEALTATIQAESGVIDRYLPMLEGKRDEKGNLIEKPTVDFSLSGKTAAWLDSFSGNPRQSTLQMGSIQKTLLRQANLILQAAKGTQTEGDAQRAYDSLTSAFERNSNAGVAQALKELKDVQRTVITSNNAYIKARGYGTEDAGWSISVKK